MKKLALLIFLFPLLAFGQAARVDIPLLTSGPNVPISGGPLPQALFVANATVQVCVHPSSITSCTAATTYSDYAKDAACSSSTPLVQLPGGACTASVGSVANIGFWYDGGVVDYFVTSSYGKFGPYTWNPGGGGGGGGLPTGQAATFPEYLASGTTVTPIATTSVPDTVRDLKIAGSTSTGPTAETSQILFLGNSKVIGNNPSAVDGYCSAASGIIGGNDALFKQAICRPSATYSCTSNVCTVILADNSDGYIQSGDRISPGFQGGIANCLYGSFTVQSVSGNSIVFDTTGSNSPCGTVAVTSIPTVLWTKGIQLFGMNGATLEAWLNSSGQYGGKAMLAYALSLVAKGITPIMWFNDAGIATNDFRVGGHPYLEQQSLLDSYISQLEVATATLPNGKTVTLGQYPIYIDNGNPMANSGTSWTAMQYVFPDGTAGSNLTTIPLITAATQSGSPVTTIAAGTQAIVNLSYCPDEIWSPGVAPPTQTNFAGLLTRENNPIQMVIDTGGSQETVTLQPFNAVSGGASQSTGVAAGAASTAVTGYLQCQVSFTPANSHTVSGLQAVATRATADQAYSTWMSQLPSDEAKLWVKITPVDFQSLIYGKQAISTDNTVYGPGDELHPAPRGYLRQQIIQQQILAPYFNTPSAILQPESFGFADDLNMVYPTTPPISSSWSETKAVKARVNGTYIAPAGDPDWCESNVAYYTVFSGTFNQAGTGFLRALGPFNVNQQGLSQAAATGDCIWTPQLHSWTPTTLSPPVYAGPNLLQFSTTGNPPIPFQNNLPGGLFLIRRPIAVDSAAWNFLDHPETFRAVLNGNLVAGGTGTFTISLNTAQPPGVPVGVAAAQVTLQGADFMVVQGNGGTVPTGGQIYALPAGGTSVASGQNLVWTDPAGTSTSYVGTGQPIQIFESRLPDTVSQQSFSIQNQSATGYNTISTSTPAITVVVTAGATGGSCSSATTYVYKIAYIPQGNPLADVGIASASSTPYTPVSGTTNVNSIRYPAPPAGFATVIYGRSGGTFNYVGSTPQAVSSWGDPCTSSPNATFPASSTDLTTAGSDVPYDDGTRASGAGLVPISDGAGTNKFHWGSGGGGSGVTSFAAPSGSWPSWLVPTVTNSTTTPSLAVAASAIPNSSLAVQTANTVLGALTATTPSGLPVPTCSATGTALNWVPGTGFTCNAFSLYPLVDITTYFPTSVNVGAMMVACHADASVLPGWTCDGTRAVQNASAVGTSWAISAGTETVSGIQNNVPVGEQVHVVHSTTTALNGDYTITARTATTISFATGSGLVSGTETVTMYSLKNTVDEVARNYNQNEKWPIAGVMYDQTPATTLATPGAPGVVPTTGTGSLPAGTYLVDVWYRSGDGVSLPSTETSVTLASTGEITITGPSTCPTYAQGWDFGITAAGGGTGTETLQGNAICGGTAIFKNAVLFPSQPAPPSAATGVPAFILWNINNPAMYADTGIARFTIRTGPSFGASNIIATGTKGISAINNISAYNFSHINMTGCSIFDSAFFSGSSRQGIGAVGTGGTSGNPSCAYKVYGTANDVKFESISLNIQDTFGTGLVIQRTPSTYNDGEGMGRLEFDRLNVVGTTSTLPLVTLAGIPCGAATNVNCFGLANVLFTTPSFETQDATSCVTMTDVAGITFKNPTCASTTFTGSNPAYLFTSTAGSSAQYQANTLDIENPATVGYPVIYNNGINGVTVTVPNNNFPYTGAYHYGGGKLPTDVWQSRPVISDSTIALSATNALTLSAMTGTSCLEEISGVVTATGSACGSGAVSSVSNSDSTLTISPTTGAVVASLNLAHANTWTATQSMPGLNLTGTTPGATSYVAGTGSIPTLTANSAGFAAPVTGGTAFLYKLPATAVAGVLHAAAPATVDGVNESAVTSSAVSLTADVSGILAPANGGSGVANSATHTLGTSNQNWATLGTGIVKNTTTTGALSNAASADILALWTGTCSSSTFLRGDGACAAAGGGLSGLTTNTVPTATSSTTIGNSTITNAATVSTVGAADTTAKTQVTIGNSSNTNGAILTILGNTSQTGNILCIGSSGCQMQMNAFGGTNISGLTASNGFNYATQLAVGSPVTTGSTCGTITAAGGQAAFQFTSTTTGACTIVITPGITATNGFECSAKDLTTTADTFMQTASTATTCTVTSTAVVTSDKIIARVGTAF